MTATLVGLFRRDMGQSLRGAMRQAGIDLGEGDGNAVLLAHAESLTLFFRGMASQGHSQKEVEGWVDWLATTVKATTFPPS